MCSVTQGRVESEGWREQKGRAEQRDAWKGQKGAEGLHTLRNQSTAGQGDNLLECFENVFSAQNSKNVPKTHGMVMRVTVLNEI